VKENQLSIKKLLVYVLCGFSTYFCMVPHVWSEMDWSTDQLHEQLVSPPDQVTQQVYFGSSVSLTDKYAIIGAKKDDQIVDDGGSAYIYEKNDNEWILVKKIVGSHNNPKDYLGISVELAGDFAFAGASSYSLNENKEVGIVYVYQRQSSGEWLQTQTLIPEAIEDTHNFGCSIAAHNTQIVVGAYGNSKESGKAFIFQLEDNQWLQRQCLEPETPDIRGRFGKDVDIYNDFIIVGAYNAFSYKGAVYFFQKREGIWKQTQLIESPSPDYYTLFGDTVAMSDHYAVVGSKAESINDVRNIGSVYVFQRNENSWTLMSKLLAPDLQIDDRFGVSIDIEGNLLAVGGTKMDSDNVDSGAVHIYRLENNQFTFLRKISAQQSQGNMLYGSALKITNNSILIGAESNKINNYPIGSAFYYSLDASSPFGSDGVLGLDDIVRYLQILCTQ